MPCTASHPAFDDESPLERSLRIQEDFEAALASHRAAWQADFDAQRAALERSFAEQKAALADELVEKARERRAVKNMVVSLVFVLRLLM